MNEYQKPGLPPENDPALDEIASMLREAAEQTSPQPSFIASLERRLVASHPGPEVTRMFTLRRIAPVLLWVLAAAAMVIAIDWAVRSIAPQPVPAAHNTPVATSQAPVRPVDQSTLVPSIKSTTSYQWRGTTLTLGAVLPDGPAEAGVYAAQPEQHATLEEAVALAQRFGVNGQAYKTPGEASGTTDFFITDGKQSLGVRSTGYYTYTSDMIASYNNSRAVQSPRAEEIIAAFLQARGFTFPYLVQWSQWRGAYLVEPLTSESTPLRYEHYAQPMLVINLDENEQVLRLMSSMLQISSEPAGRYRILSAEEAFQKLLDPNNVTGIVESGNSVPAPIQQWNRSYPTDQTITIYGYVTSAASVQPDQPAFIQIDGVSAVGQVAGLEQYATATYVQATGHFVIENGIERFSVDSWQPSPIMEDGLLGTLDRKDGQAVLTTQEGDRYVLPDVPADVPMPFENAYVTGAREGDVFQWKIIDNRMTAMGGGGGGGGGGLGFYKLNLSGTPVPFPTPTAIPVLAGGSGSNEAQYTVQAGDTSAKIAQHFGLTTDQLMQANGMKDPGQLMIGQTLIIPGTEARKIEGLRGILSITITKQQDGSQEVAYGFIANASSDPGGYILLEGDGLDALQAYNSRPVDIWGTLEAAPNGSMLTIMVDRFDIPFPDLKYQKLRGTQKVTQVSGQPATLFTTEDGKTYIQLLPDGTTGRSLIGREGDTVQLEALAIPDENVGGYPALRVYGGGVCEGDVCGGGGGAGPDQPMVVEVPSNGMPPEVPTLNIERVELVHFMSDPRYATSVPASAQLYFQPVWRFYGHYSNGDEFEILIQALRQDYLLPEIEPVLQPG